MIQKNKHGFTLVEIMIVAAIIALLAAIAIPNMLRVKIEANETIAKATLSSMAKALELFANANEGVYPIDFTVDLVESDPPYMGTDYCWQKFSGYDYTCSLSSDGYILFALPSVQDITGNTTYTAETGAILKALPAG